MTTVKQTAANNVVLARIKILFNVLVFKRAAILANTEGMTAVRQYVGTMFCTEVREEQTAAICD